MKIFFYLLIFFLSVNIANAQRLTFERLFELQDLNPVIRNTRLIGTYFFTTKDRLVYKREMRGDSSVWDESFISNQEQPHKIIFITTSPDESELLLNELTNCPSNTNPFEKGFCAQNINNSNAPNSISLTTYVIEKLNKLIKIGFYESPGGLMRWGFEISQIPKQD